MSDIARVKANIASMIDQGAPESDIDAYVASEGVGMDQLHGNGSASKPAPSQAPAVAPPASPSTPAGNPLDSNMAGAVANAPPGMPADQIAVIAEVKKRYDAGVANHVPRAKLQPELEAYMKSQGFGLEDAKAWDAMFGTGGRMRPSEKKQPKADPGIDWKHDSDFYADQIRRGILDIGDVPAGIADLLRASGNWAKGDGFQSDLGLPDWARPGTLANEAIDDKLTKRDGSLPTSRNALQRYTGAVARLAPSAVGGGATLGARGLVAGVTSATAGGVAGQAARDVAPTMGWNPDTAQTVGEMAGSVLGGLPVAAAPIADARFVAKRVSDPRSPFAAKAVEKMDKLAEASKPNGVFPKGRGPLSVEQINGIGKEFLNEIEPRLSKMGLNDADKARFAAALRRKADITPDEIAALEGSEAGDAIAEGLRYFQATRALTPGYNGYKPGPIRRALEMGISVAGAAKLGPLGAVLGPMVRRAVRGDPADLNMSRLDAGRNALKRKDAWAKIGAKTGSDKVGEKTAAFIKKHDDTVAANEAEAATQATAKAETQATRNAAAAERRDQQLFKQTFPNRPTKAPEPQAPGPSATATKAASALKKLDERTVTSSTAKAIDKLNTPPKPKPEAKPKARPALDIAVENNIKQGIHGNYNAYADTLGVQRSDVLAALRRIKTDDVDPFEIQKLTHGYKLSPAGRAALIPRLQKQLQDGGVTEFRAKQAASAPVEKPAKAKAAEPVTTNIDGTEPPAAEAPDSRIRKVVRPDDYNRGTNAFQRKADREIEGIATDADIPSGRRDEVLNAAEIVKHEHKTVQSANHWIDFEYVPKLEADGVDPRVIDLIQQRLKRVAEVGKKHRTQADLDAAIAAGPRGRPRAKPAPADDDVPF